MDNGTCPTTTWTSETEPTTNWTFAGCLGTIAPVVIVTPTPVITTNGFDGTLLGCAGLLS